MVRLDAEHIQHFFDTITIAIFETSDQFHAAVESVMFSSGPRWSIV